MTLKRRYRGADSHQDTISFWVMGRQLAVPAFAGLVGGTLILYAYFAIAGPPLTSGELRTYSSSVVLGSVVLALFPPRYGVKLTHERLIVHGNRRREIPWSDITSMEIRKSGGVRNIEVSLLDGHRITLRAPMPFLDPQFEEKYKTFIDWWTSHRGHMAPPSGASGSA